MEQDRLAEHPGGSTPDSLMEEGANVARLFPELVMALGAPNLEEQYVSLGESLQDQGLTCAVEVLLQSRHPSRQIGAPQQACVSQGINSPSAQEPQASPLQLRASSGPINRRLHRLADDFETLAGHSPDVRAHSLQNLICDFEALAYGQSPERTSESYSWQSGALPTSCGLRRPDAFGSDHASTQLQSADPLHKPCASSSTDAVVKEVHELSARRTPNRGFSEPKDDRTPRSARGGPAHQGSASEGQGPGQGRSRNSQSASKAAAWRSQRQPLTIAITKFQSLPLEPFSPKWVKCTKEATWGPEFRSVAHQSFQDRSAESIKERMEKRLTQMFGTSKHDRAALGLHQKYSTIG